MINNFIIIVNSWHLAFKHAYSYLGMSMFNSVYEVYPYATQWSTSWLKCTQMALAISMLKNIFPLHTKTQDYHLTYPNVLLQIS